LRAVDDSGSQGNPLPPTHRNTAHPLAFNTAHDFEHYGNIVTYMRLNGMTHEDRRDEAVISDSFYRIKGVPIATRRFVIHKWRPELVAFGLLDKGTYRYSDPEKTVLDLAYWDHWRAAKGKAETRTWMDHVANVRSDKLRKYLRHYPVDVARAVEGIL